VPVARVYIGFPRVCANSVQDKVDVHAGFGANFGASCLSSWA